MTHSHNHTEHSDLELQLAAKIQALNERIQTLSMVEQIQRLALVKLLPNIGDQVKLDIAGLSLPELIADEAGRSTSSLIIFRTERGVDIRSATADE